MTTTAKQYTLIAAAYQRALRRRRKRMKAKRQEMEMQMREGRLAA